MDPNMRTLQEGFEVTVRFISLYLFSITNIVVINHLFHQFLHSQEEISLQGLVYRLSPTHISSYLRLVNSLNILPLLLQVVYIQSSVVLQKVLQFEPSFNPLIRVLNVFGVPAGGPVGSILPNFSSGEIILAPPLLSAPFTPIVLAVVRIYSPFNIFSPGLEVVLLLLYLILSIFTYVNLNTIERVQLGH